MAEVENGKTEIYTVGHSTRDFDDFVSVLKRYGIRRVLDVRRFPSSKKFPQFNRGELERSLPENGIRYVWMESLGGRRHGEPALDSPNVGLRSAGFRNYADYMGTEEFRRAIDAVLAEAKLSPTAIMCAERLYFRCHRMLISDCLTAMGVRVLHIGTANTTADDRAIPHALTSCAIVENGRLTYPAATS